MPIGLLRFFSANTAFKQIFRVLNSAETNSKYSVYIFLALIMCFNANFNCDTRLKLSVNSLVQTAILV